MAKTQNELHQEHIDTLTRVSGIFETQNERNEQSLAQVVASADQKKAELAGQVDQFVEVAAQSIAADMSVIGGLRCFMTAGGRSSYFFGFPQCQIEDLYPDGSMGTGTHPAFITADGEAKILWVSAYHLALVGGEMVSQPGLMPKISMTQDEERAYCVATTIAGQSGHRLASIWDMALMKSITRAMIRAGMEEPARNDAYGKYSLAPHVRGHGSSGITNGSMGAEATHNRQIAGVHNAYGGHWTRVDGAPVIDGEIFLPANNDPLSIAAPVTTGNFYSGSSATANGTISIVRDAASVVRNGALGDSENAGNYDSRPGAAGFAGISGDASALVRLSGMASVGDGLDMGGGAWVRNYGTRAPLLFGLWSSGSSAGPAAMAANNSPSFRSSSIAVRSAFLEF